MLLSSSFTLIDFFFKTLILELSIKYSLNGTGLSVLTIFLNCFVGFILFNQVIRESIFPIVADNNTSNAEYFFNE